MLPQARGVTGSGYAAGTINNSGQVCGYSTTFACGPYGSEDPYDIILIRHLAYFQLGEAPLHQGLCNIDRPEKSLLLLAPLAKGVGGLQRCGQPVFADRADPDYREILAAIQDASQRLAQHKRFDMFGFRPNRFYIREMQHFGVLPKTLPDDVPVDTYAADRAYWKTFEQRATTTPKSASATR